MPTGTVEVGGVAEVDPQDDFAIISRNNVNGTTTQAVRRHTVRDADNVRTGRGWL